MKGQVLSPPHVARRAGVVPCLAVSGRRGWESEHPMASKIATGVLPVRKPRPSGRGINLDDGDEDLP